MGKGQKSDELRKAEKELAFHDRENKRSADELIIAKQKTCKFKTEK